MRKTGYRFNPETLSYDKIEFPLRKKIRIFLQRSFSTLSLAIVIFFVVSSFVDSPKEKTLKRENDEILAQYNLLSSEIEKLDDILKNLESRDDNIYRVIFESEPIDYTIRRAGTGGVDKYKNLKNLTNSNLIINTSKKLDELSKAMYIQSKSYDDIEKLVKNKEEMLASIPAIIPISMKDKKCRISSGFGMRMDPFYKQQTKMHYGMDFAGPIGTPIYATGNGTIEFAGYEKGYGKHVKIDHGFTYSTVYGHMNEFNVRKGQKVKRGEVIGYVGNTGKSKGPHVHYEVRKNDVPVDPINFYYNDLSPDEFDQLVADANNNGQALD
ncbi:MAG: M23 family metallopeptidase [Culturomica sp.]|jgi:murein DD-endopeptidase MepM/ murein hydrolase activator NlpD|nr:M23 family metallopeptidase [Culturomica sp.]